MDEILGGMDEGLLGMPVIGTLLKNPIACAIVLTLIIIFLVHIVNTKTTYVKLGLAIFVLLSLSLSAYYYSLDGKLHAHLTNDIITMTANGGAMVDDNDTNITPATF